MENKTEEILLGFELEVHLPYREDRFGMSETTEAPDETPWIARKTVAIELSKILQVDVLAPRKLKKVTKNWAVCPENDIDHCDIEGSLGVVEIISPPMPMKKALDYFSQVCEYCLDNGLFASMLCGLHLNLSLPSWKYGDRYVGEGFKLNLIKLIDERFILKELNRTSSVYTNTHYDRLIPFAAYRLKLDENYSPNDDLGELIEGSKSYAINFANMKSSKPYVEFRHFGGEHILHKEDWIKDIAIKLAETILAAECGNRQPAKLPAKYEKLMADRSSEFDEDMRNTLKIYKFASPEVAIRNVDRGPFGVLKSMFVTTKYGDIAMVHNGPNIPCISLHVDNSMYLKLDERDLDVMSQRGPLELSEVVACYLLLKFKKYTDFALPFEEVDHFIDDLLGKSKSPIISN
jgi:hypothetical protein|tara:strand:+ start:152 stop:1366 length:1215 start_codon:yes stop_codon:yes gene_type:complete